MNTGHLGRIRCIRCGGRFLADHHEAVVENGVIECGECGAEYPVIRSVPRLLDGDLLADCMAFYSDMVSAQPRLKAFYHKTIGSGRPRGGTHNKEEKLKARTQKTFSYEWNTWKTMPEFAMNHFLEVVRVPEEFFAGKSGWDPAVGIGKDLINALKAVGPDGFMLGSDLSYAVDVAYDRCREYPNALIVQADLYSSFVEDESLDFAYMIGLIQHLTDPGKGIEQVYGKVAGGGYFVGTVYGKPDSALMKMLVAVIRLMRVFTTRLPLPVVVWISRLFAVPSYLFFKMPSSLLARSRYVQEVSDQYPTQQTERGKPDFSLLTNTWFDHFTAPIIGFYSDEEIMDLLSGVRLEKLELKHGIFTGFKPAARLKGS
jgi:ubiquinone/menaquinone biosynthesis C-methylase UbiE/ribosomal protein S27AE